MDKPHIIAIDVDGVLTDGKLHIDHTGEKMFKSFHTRDVRSIRELVANGFEVYLVSADNSNIGKCFAEKVGAVFLHMRDKSKLPEILKRPYIAVGDDAWDVGMMKGAVKSYYPSDADISVTFGHVGAERLNTEGGKGVIAELVNILL